MELEELYDNIFDMEGVPQHPAYHGFSYGLLMVEDGRPLCCFYVNEQADQKLQFILSHGMLQFYVSGSRKTEIFYGYVTDGTQFFCEEQIYPRENQWEGGLL